MKLSVKQQAELAHDLAELAALAAQVRREVDAELAVSRGNWATVPPTLPRNAIQPRRPIVHQRRSRPDPKPVAPARPQPLPGEIRMRDFTRQEAELLQTTPNAIWYRIRMGYYCGLQIRRFNRAVVFVNTAGMTRRPMASTGGRPSLSGLSEKKLGRKEYCRKLWQLKKTTGFTAKPAGHK